MTRSRRINSTGSISRETISDIVGPATYRGNHYGVLHEQLVACGRRWTATECQRRRTRPGCHCRSGRRWRAASTEPESHSDRQPQCQPQCHGVSDFCPPESRSRVTRHRLRPRRGPRSDLRVCQLNGLRIREGNPMPGWDSESVTVIRRPPPGEARTGPAPGPGAGRAGPAGRLSDSQLSFQLGKWKTRNPKKK